jgi:polyhydroxybutyrate depolymerase
MPSGTASGNAVSLPLVVVLHGYGSSGAQHDEAWGFSKLGEQEGFMVALPDGTLDRDGKRFWNATDACCNFFGSTVDDVAYMRALLDDVAARAPLDPKRVFVVGHSNGGFFAHRLACDVSERIAAVVSLAGATFRDGSRCTPTSPVAIAQVHGTDDRVIRPEGGRVFDRLGFEYPSVASTMSQWATTLSCAGEPDRGVATLDLDGRIPGPETRVDRWRACKAGLELWTVDRGTHIPAMTGAWAAAVWAFFRAHPKP